MSPTTAGFLHGRVAPCDAGQLIVYCRSPALAASGPQLDQFFTGVQQLPVPIEEVALVISDNADIYGTPRDLLDRAGPDGSVARVFVHFPDPWWKKRHAKRRVLGPSFLDTLARLLEPGGALYVQTDVEARALLYRDLIAAHADFALDGGRGWVEANPFGARSNREARADEDGLPVYRLLAHRLPLGPPAP